ncbi:MAG: sialate O-acetylesterase [Phycisphaeraceae bacterium]
MQHPRCFAFVLAAASLLAGLAAHAAEPVKVFILVGQSNMQGHASMVTLNHQIHDPRTEAVFAHLHDGEGKYKSRDDVYIDFIDRRGTLTVGYGANPDKFGPELGFGWVVGEHYDQPVLIIKAAYGGRSLFRDFRPPSAGLPAEAHLQQELENAIKNTTRNNERRNRNDPLPTMDDIKAKYGFAYRDMVGEIKRVRENYKALFPQFKDRELDFAGFVWFQGWNDMINATNSAAYTDNLRHFIKDVRQEVGVADLPFVIGQLGVDGPYEGDDKANDKKEQFKARQAAAAEGLKNVSVVKTDQYWDPVAAKQYKVWREDIDEWRKYGNDHGYHYLGSPLIIYRIGEAFGEAMIGLQ